MPGGSGTPASRPAPPPPSADWPHPTGRVATDCAPTVRHTAPPRRARPPRARRAHAPDHLPAPLDHLPAPLDLRGKLALWRDAQELADLGALWRKPALRHTQFAVHPRPEAHRLVGQRQEGAHLTALDRAQPPVVVAPRTCGLRARLDVGALIQNQDTALPHD